MNRGGGVSVGEYDCELRLHLYAFPFIPELITLLGEHVRRKRVCNSRAGQKGLPKKRKPISDFGKFQKDQEPVSAGCLVSVSAAQNHSTCQLRLQVTCQLRLTLKLTGWLASLDLRKPHTSRILSH